MKAKVISSIWYHSGMNSIGVVGVETEYDGIKFYIGVAPGGTREEDEQYIAEWGSRFDEAGVNEFFNHTKVKH